MLLHTTYNTLFFFSFFFFVVFSSYLLLRYSSTSEHHTYRTATDIQRLRHTHNHPYYSVKKFITTESMASKKSVQIVLAIIMASLLQNSSASIYNASCLVKANYLPTASLGSYTCDSYLGAISQSGQMLASVNWATVTPAFIAAMADVQGQTMISQFEYWSLSCCVRIK